jgi:signal transduction histidine kinase
MRRLSRRLVSAQEDERRRLARELHDEVGQMLTALRMELGKAERLRPANGPGFAAGITECKRIIDTVMESVRALSMGLRPAMLDDFGLGAALDWHGRDFSRRYGVPVFLTVEGDVDRLPEPHRTSVYRIVQEALTNCARHARAGRVEVTLRDAGGACTPARPRRRDRPSRGRDARASAWSGSRSGSGRYGGTSPSIRAGTGTTLEIDIPVPPGKEGANESAAG